jgi:calcium-dependent protein kinase
MGCTISTKYRKKPNDNYISDINQVKLEPSLFILENKKRFQEVYRIAQNLGNGTYGDIKTCFHKETGQKRAVKLFRKDLLQGDDTKENLTNEFKILKGLDHPNIIRTYELFEDTKRFYLVIEYCSGGDLFTEILKRHSFSEQDAAKIFFQIVSAVHYLHNQGILHGDLTPENILLEDRRDSLSVKLADFGSALKISEKLEKSSVMGKAYYLAPEAYDGISAETSTIWSCGVILYILLCGHPPFDGENDEEIITHVRRGRFSMEGRVWEKVSAEAKELIHKMLCPRNERISAAVVLQHPWLKNHLEINVSRSEVKLVLDNLKNFHASNKLKDAIITFITVQCASFKETKELKEVFLKIDKDGDGKLSRRELFESLRVSLSDDEAEMEVERIMNQVDSDNSGFIDYTEFLRANLDMKQFLSEENLKSAFQIFDRDGSGKISADEIKKMFQGNKESDENVWLSIIKGIDANGDGEIDLQEFKSLVSLKFVA